MLIFQMDFRKHFEPVQLLRNPEELGFGKSFVMKSEVVVTEAFSFSPRLQQNSSTL
jgi:hypothetical protein